jgi:hypothetical protein
MVSDMRKRLKDYNIEQVSSREKVSGQVLPIKFSNDEATKRVVMHSARRVLVKFDSVSLFLAPIVLDLN